MFNGVLLVAIIATWILKVTFLPKLLYRISTKRAITIRKLQNLEKVEWKTVKIKFDLKDLQTCLDLDLCPEFLKFKPPNFKVYNKPRDIYQLVVKKKLKEIKCEENLADCKYQTMKIGIFKDSSFLEKSCFVHLLKKKFEQNSKTILNTHQRKSINLYRKQTSRVPHAITNLSNKKLSLKEINALRY